MRVEHKILKTHACLTFATHIISGMDNETLAKTILASLSTLEKIEDVLNKLIPDLIEIDEKIAAIEALPKVLHVDEVCWF